MLRKEPFGSNSFSFAKIFMKKPSLTNSTLFKKNVLPRDFALGLSGGLDRVSGQVVEGDEVPDHAHGLVERAVTIVGGVAVLLKEVVL